MDEQKDQDYRDQEFERYGVWVKAGPEEVLEADEEFSMADLDEVEASPAGASLDIDEEEDGLVSLDDLDLEEPAEETDPFDLVDEEEEDFDLGALSESLDDDFENLTLEEEPEEEPDHSMPGSDDEFEDITLEDLDEHRFTPEDEGIEIQPEGARNTITADEEEFLREEEETPGQDEGDLQISAESAIPSSMDFQEREAFERIQNELIDIKRELAELKEVLRGTVSVPRDVPAPQDEVEEDLHLDSDTAEETAAAGSTGFFEDEEDETIALTGDELDNILNTAEFTEEAGEAEELDDDFLVEEEPAEQPGSVLLEGDDSAVDELADLDIDQELAGIDSLQDETESETDDALGEIELDLDSLDEMEPAGGAGDELELDDEDLELDEVQLDEPPLDTTVTEEEEADLKLDEMELEEPPLEEEAPAPEPAMGEDPGLDEIDLEEEEEVQLDEPPLDTAVTEEDEEDLELDEIETDEIETDEIETDELELDDLELDEIELDEPQLEEAEPAPEPQLDEIDLEEEVPPDESPLDTALTEDDEADLELDEIQLDEDDFPAESATEGDEELELGEVDLQDEEPSTTDEGFEDFAAAVEQDLETGDTPGERESDHLDFDLEIVPGDESEGVVEAPEEAAPPRRATIADLPEDLKQEIRSVLSYMDQLLEALPDDKIEEFAQSEHFEVYKHLFEELGLET